MNWVSWLSILRADIYLSRLRKQTIKTINHGNLHTSDITSKAWWNWLLGISMWNLILKSHIKTHGSHYFIYFSYFVVTMIILKFLP